jgi:carbon storage regulator
MLVLTRRPTESIVIANNIKITVVSVGPGRVKLGIEAPPNVRVDRKEIHDKIEHSSDVLAAVGSATADAQATIVGHAGPDTAMIVSTAPAEAVTEAVPVGTPQVATANVPGGENEAAGAPPLPMGKLGRFRAPRKPR